MNTSNPSKNNIQALRALSLTQLMDKALQMKLKRRGDKFSLCNIFNAKSGLCSEDCGFCIQSSHYGSNIKNYPLKPVDDIVGAARIAERIGAHHFSIVTSGRGPTPDEVAAVADAIAEIRRHVRIKVCASLGIMNRKDLKVLKNAGLSRYHHNIETSKEFFPKIVTTHSFADRIDTISAARDAGLEVCAGGIFGLGESEDDRVSMAMTLKEQKVDSVPLNILIPGPGTPLMHARLPAVIEILRAIALFRLILEKGAIRLAAGREAVLGDFLGMAFMDGADGLMIGGYLTRQGRPLEDDLGFVRNMKEIWTA